MRKILIFSLFLTLFLTLLLAACGKVDPPVTTAAPETTVVPETTIAPETTTVSETTATSAKPSVPILVPEITIAEEYTKNALGYETSFQHTVTYPKILSDAPGAAALNQQFYETYGRIVETLKADAEENTLYEISFSSSAYDGILFIRIVETISEIVDSGNPIEGIWLKKTYEEKAIYYDAASDRQITLEEYIEHFAIDLEKAEIGMLTSFEIENKNIGKGTAFVSETIGGEAVFSPESNRVYFLQYPALQKNISLYGVEVTEDTLCLYYAGRPSEYDFYESVCCPLRRDTYAPIHPNYTCTVRLSEDVEESDTVEITFESGSVSGITAPSVYGIDKIEITAKELRFKAYDDVADGYPPLFPQGTEDLTVYDIIPYYDGKEPHTTGFGSLTGREYCLGLRIYEYMPIDTLKTLTITIQKREGSF